MDLEHTLLSMIQIDVRRECARAGRVIARQNPFATRRNFCKTYRCFADEASRREPDRTNVALEQTGRVYSPRRGRKGGGLLLEKKKKGLETKREGIHRGVYPDMKETTADSSVNEREEPIGETGHKTNEGCEGVKKPAMPNPCGGSGR